MICQISAVCFGKLHKSMHMEIKEYSPIGLEVIGSNHAIILGISINNSYFKAELLEKLLAWATASAGPVYVMIPDEPAVHTLMALGKTQQDAERVARLKSNSLENKCLEIVQRFGLRKIQIIRWGCLVANECYQAALLEIRAAFEKDASFRTAVRNMTASVLKGDSTPEAIEMGVHFLLQELAFITRADQILGEDKVAYVYHKTMDVLKEVIMGRYVFRASPNVGFITAE